MSPTPSGDDEAAVRRVLAGDISRFDGIVRRWQGRLVSLAWRFCRDRTMAEDMAQEAFVKAFRALPTFRGDAAFSTWLTAVALNTYRSLLREHAPAASDAELARAVANEPDALRGLEDQERASILRRAVLALPARYRDPLVLFYFHEMDLAETARVLGIPEGTLKARLHRGRRLLRQRSGGWFAALTASSRTI